MNQALVLATSLAALLSANAIAGNDSCTIAQVMKTIHQNRAYRHFEYASDYEGNQAAPTLKQHETNDQYLFWIDNNGQTCPAVVTYESGKCTAGTGVVRLNDCQ